MGLERGDGAGFSVAGACCQADNRAFNKAVAKMGNEHGVGTG